MQKLSSILEKGTITAIGLMSGTSADGVDSALVLLEGHSLDTRLELIRFLTYPYPQNVRRRLNRLFAPSNVQVEELCEMNFIIGEVFAEAALEVIRQASMSPSDVDIIGSHGQTICHLPMREPRSTLQIGEPSVIAQRTGIITVADFRANDVAAGGQGAPLIPYVDFILFRDQHLNRAIQNIGGISNVTFLPAGCNMNDIIAFDTGPGNMVIDEITKVITNGKQAYDKDGELSSKGKVNIELLDELCSHEFIHRLPPKSTGRETFGAHFVQELLIRSKHLNLSEIDLLTTVTMFTAKSIYINYSQFILPRYNISEIVVSGGGAHNLTLMKYLRDMFGTVDIKTSDDFGIPVDAKEAMAFAILANETIHGVPTNVPHITGAKRNVALGKIIVP